MAERTPAEIRGDLMDIANMLRLRARQDDTLDMLELLQLARMLQNLAEGKGALGVDPPWRIIRGGRP
jgi:hypothetical protein